MSAPEVTPLSSHNSWIKHFSAAEDALRQAMTTRDLTALKQVLGLDPSIEREDGWHEAVSLLVKIPHQALVLAIEQRWVESLPLLVQAGAPLDTEPKAQTLRTQFSAVHTLLNHVLAMGDHQEGNLATFGTVLEVLVGLGASTNVVNDQDEPPLHWVILNVANEDLAESMFNALLRLGADPNGSSEGVDNRWKKSDHSTSNNLNCLKLKTP